MSRRTRITALLARAAAAAAIAAPPASAVDDLQNASFDVAGMAQNIESRLGGVTGWAYAIARDGSLAVADAGGKAQTAADGNVDTTASSRMEIWSATKTITAAAALKLLEAHPMAGLDSAVATGLSQGWRRGPGFNGAGVTFRRLLNHTSGSRQVGDALSDWSARPASGTRPGTASGTRSPGAGSPRRTTTRT